MPRNVYFSQAVRSEQHLYEDLIIESLKIFGQDVYYIPRTLVNRDNILGEDPASKFDDAYIIEAYLENVEGFEGAGDLYSKFGLEIRDEAQFVVSRKVWNRRVGVFSDNEDPRPQEGDLIFLPMTNSFFEITYVEDDSPFYQLSDLPVYRLSCSLFEYNDEDFDTGVEGIDLKINQVSYQTPLAVTLTTNEYYFEIGETVEQTLVAAVGATPAVKVFGEVAQASKTGVNTQTIWVSNVGASGTTEYKQFTQGGTITGLTNSYTATVTSIISDLTDTTGQAWKSDGGSENIAIETFADGFIDFSESNPFGDPSETY